jgi:hypothetical protein
MKSYDTFLNDIVEHIKDKYNIHVITLRNYIDSTKKIEEIVINKIPNDIDFEFLIFKNINHRNIEIRTGNDNISNTFRKIVIAGVIADVLYLFGYDDYYQKNLI